MASPHTQKFQRFWLAEHKHGKYNAFDWVSECEQYIYFLKIKTGILTWIVDINVLFYNIKRYAFSSIYMSRSLSRLRASTDLIIFTYKPMLALLTIHNFSCLSSEGHRCYRRWFQCVSQMPSISKSVCTALPSW